MLELRAGGQQQRLQLRLDALVDPGHLHFGIKIRDIPHAVEYITYTVSQDNRPYSEIKLALGYRRTEEQVKSIVHATSISALHALLTAAAETSAEELVVQVGYFQDQAQEVRDIAVQVEQEVLDAEEPTWQVEFYPNESAAGIIEILMKN